MNSENTQREELHPLLAGGAAHRVGDEFVGQFRRSTAAGRAPAPRGGGADQEQRQTPTTAISMNSAELVKAISVPPIWPTGNELVDLELMNRIGHRPVVIPASYVQHSVFALDHARRAHHVEHAGGEAEQQKHDHPPRRESEPAIEQPADDRADQDAGDQFGREPEAAGDRRRIGGGGRGPVSLSDARLAVWPSRSPRRWSLAERAASSVRRVSAIALSARVVSHAFDTRADCEQSQRVPPPSKPRGPY